MSDLLSIAKAQRIRMRDKGRGEFDSPFRPVFRGSQVTEKIVCVCCGRVQHCGLRQTIKCLGCGINSKWRFPDEIEQEAELA